MRVGFIGLGLMGSGMTNNLQKAGHQLVLHDLRARGGGEADRQRRRMGRSPARRRGVGRGRVHLAARPARVRGVAAGKNGLIEGMQRGQALFDLSTNSPTVIRRLHKLFADKGAHLLDSPVSGGPAGAPRARWRCGCSGDEASYNKYRPVLDAMGDQIFYMGDVGAASVAKLVHNLAGYMVNTRSPSASPWA
jgi:3-hydroxyisobutyrate dehydrogenase